MTGAGSGGGGGYDYVETFFPGDAEEGESLYHLTENAAFVYTGSQWVEQTVTDHSQLSGVNEGDHRSDQRVSDLAPLQTVNGRTGDVTGLFEASDYTPEADTHDRYTDAEASAAAPVKKVNGQTGEVSISASLSPEFSTDSYSYQFDGGVETQTAFRSNEYVWYVSIEGTQSDDADSIDPNDVCSVEGVDVGVSGDPTVFSKSFADNETNAVIDLQRKISAADLRIDVKKDETFGVATVDIDIEVGTFAVSL